MTTSALGLTTQDTPVSTNGISTIPTSPIKPGKSIIVFCDGTGQDGLTTSLTKEEAKALPPTHAQATPYPTNVLRLSRCIPLYTEIQNPGRLQLVYYQSGVGAGDDFRGASDFGDDYERARGTATGSKIRDAYNFIAQNYHKGDKIYLFGFSRGAYTARKVAGLICKLGLLDRRGMGNFFHYWSALDRGALPDGKVGMEANVDFIGTWDTVGSVYEELSAPKLNALSLIDTELPEGVKKARHALAFHENRKEFLPTPYTGYHKDRDVQQVWFPGAHSDVGGGYNEHLIADITLCWMAGEAVDAGLELEESFLLDCLLTLPPDAAPELRLHFERHRLLTVDRMNVLVQAPNHPGEVSLSNVAPDFTYHQSLWAEIRESATGSSRTAFGGKPLAPPRNPLTAFEKVYWDTCGWNRLVPLPMVKARVPIPRGQSPSFKVQTLRYTAKEQVTPVVISTISPAINRLGEILQCQSKHPVKFESVQEYYQGLKSPVTDGAGL